MRIGILVIGRGLNWRASGLEDLQQSVEAVRTSESVPELLRSSAAMKLDLILISCSGPVEKSLPALRSLRQSPYLWATPVLVLASGGGKNEIVGALDAGADDVLIAPFQPSELRARLRARFRRASMSPGGSEKDSSVQIAGWRLDPMQHLLVSVSGDRVALTQTEFALFCLLIRSAGRVISRAELKAGALARESVSSRTVDVHLTSLRKKLGRWAAQIETVRGIGYRFVVEMPAEATPIGA